MFQLVEWGTAFVDGMAEVGKFIMSEPLAWLADAIYDAESLWGGIPIVNTILRWITDGFLSQPIAVVLVGGGLVGMLTYKVVKFILSIIP